MKACACIRNYLAGFRVHLDDFDIAFKICIVGKVAVGLTVLCDIHIEIGQKLTTVPAFDLMNGVNTVRQVFCLCKAVFVTNKVIMFGFFCIFIGAGFFKVHFKFSACLRRFKLCFAVVGMLNQSDIALDDLLGYIVSGEIVFYGVVFSLCADMMCGFVQQITLAGTDFTHRPIITADIIFCGELTVCVCCLTRKMQKSDKQSAKLLTCKMQKRPFKE